MRPIQLYAIAGVLHKICPKCNTPKTLGSFAKNRRMAFGLQSWCKACMKAKNAARYAAKKDSIDAYNAAWRENNREHHRALSLRWNRANPRRVKTNTQNWQSRKPEANAMKTRRYRLRKRGNGGFATAEDINAIAQAQQGRCYYCSTGLTVYHIDHKIPVSRGGTSWPDNLCLACPECNRRKNAKTTEEFIAYSRILE